MGFAKALMLGLVLAACASSVPTLDSGPGVFQNQGGALEGHTPRGFAGMGSGLFAGDNLNSGFPNGDGLQIFLTFELSDETSTVSSAVLFSERLVVRGSPFTDLGALTVEGVSYESFGPPLFDLQAESDPVACERVGETGLRCDVSEIASGQIVAGGNVIQLRLKFEKPGDGDGEQDLAMFYESDPNTNQPGLFTLTIEG